MKTMDYWTADLHLGHSNIIKYCNRPFDNVEVMDATILANINKTVKQDDRLFILGDFTFKDPARYLRRINCNNVWLIKGNHDKRPSKRDGFVDVRDYYAANFDIGEKHKKFIVMFHYPIRNWDKSHHGSWHLYGHVHGGISGPRGMDPENKRLMMDVGVDCHDFKPLSLTEMTWLMGGVKWEDPRERWAKEGKLWKGKDPIPENLLIALQDLMEDRFIQKWWITPIDAWDKRTPRQVVAEGDEELVWQAIQAMRSGHPS